VARAITKLGGKARVIYPAGGTSREYLRELLEKEGPEGF
jgi:fructose-1-phosphate kinase PfkB-like protein